MEHSHWAQERQKKRHMMVKSLDSWSQFLAQASEEILSELNRTFASTQPCFIPIVSYSVLKI